MNKFVKALGVVVLLTFIFVAYRIFLAPDIFVMSGNSMFPTYHAEDKLVTNNDTSVIERGYVVIYSITTPSGKDGYLVKRVVGLPGETIEIKDGQIYVNGVIVQVSSIPIVKSGKDEPDTSPAIQLKSGQYYVLGDNTPESSDSRFTGPISSSQIKAIVTDKY